MKNYNFRQYPIRVHGVPFFEEKKEIYRLPKQVIEKTQMGEWVGHRCPGTRLCFRTDAESFTVKITFQTLSLDIGMSLAGAQGAAVFIGDRRNARYAGLVMPCNYETKSFGGTFHKSAVMEDVTVFLPRNEWIEDVEICVDDTAVFEEPTPYLPYKPILYYGSSITEGAHATCVFNAYNAIISNHLNLDYYNFGFSGGAKGELEVADYINELDLSIFVYDYDHNAPTAEHLAKTHEPFFKRIREKHPLLPVIMMSRPDAVYDEEEKQRRDIIYQTYLNAVNDGDKNVYFIDGESFVGKEGAMYWSPDTIHPNDWTFHKMAEKLEPIIMKILRLGE